MLRLSWVNMGVPASRLVHNASRHKWSDQEAIRIKGWHSCQAIERALPKVPNRDHQTKHRLHYWQVQVSYRADSQKRQEFKKKQTCKPPFFRQGHSKVADQLQAQHIWQKDSLTYKTKASPRHLKAWQHSFPITKLRIRRKRSWHQFLRLLRLSILDQSNHTKQAIE